MQIRPVGSKKDPAYPRKENITEEMLKASPPQRWTKNAAAKIALGTLAVVSLAGCAPEMQTAGVPAPPSGETEGSTVWETPLATSPAPSETPIIEMTLSGDVMPPTINIAPLFVHGDGIGAFGCVMVAPPVFLSEDEALSVINGVAKDYGLAFSADVSVEFSNVLQPSVNIMEPENTPPSNTMVTLKPDFSDEDHGVAIEFVSVEDVKGWAQEGSVASSVEQYDTKGTAAQLSDALDDAFSDTLATTAVLYDPCEFSEESEKETRKLSVEQLKNQARDFFEWLKSQGVI